MGYKSIRKFSKPITMQHFLLYFLYLKKNYAKFYSTDHLFRYSYYFESSQSKSYEPYQVIITVSYKVSDTFNKIFIVWLFNLILKKELLNFFII